MTIIWQKEGINLGADQAVTEEEAVEAVEAANCKVCDFSHRALGTLFPGSQGAKRNFFFPSKSARPFPILRCCCGTIPNFCCIQGLSSHLDGTAAQETWEDPRPKRQKRPPKILLNLFFRLLSHPCRLTARGAGRVETTTHSATVTVLDPFELSFFPARMPPECFNQDKNGYVIDFFPPLSDPYSYVFFSA